MRRTLACTVVALALLGCSDGDGSRTAADPVRVEGVFVNVAVHGGTQKQAERVQLVVETAWEIAASPFGAAGLVPDPKPTVHLYLTAGSFDEADQRLAGGRYLENRAFAQHAPLGAHVDLQPRLGSVALADGGFPAQTERLLAHETAHLVRYALIPHGEKHGRWLADGTAILAADRTMRQLHGGFGPESEPFTSTLIALAQRVQAGETSHSYAKILAGETHALDFLERYALHYTAVRLLLEGPYLDGAEHFLQSLRTDPPEPDPASLRARLSESLELESLGDLDAVLAEYLAVLRPQWIELRRSLETTPPHWDHVAYGSGPAVAWRTADTGPQYALRGDVSFRRGARGPMRVLLGRQPDGHIAVSFVPDEGVVVSRRHEKDGELESEAELGRVTVRGMPDGWPFEIVADGTSLDVLVDGISTIRLHRRPDEVDVRLEGPWGLEVAEGAAGSWEGFEVVKDR